MIAAMRRITFALCLLCLGLALPTNARAEAVMPLAMPSGSIVLSIQGKIQSTNQATKANFDLEMLKRLPVTEVSTHTPWTNGLTHYKGVSVAELLRLVAANGTHGEFTALNDYSVRIPLTDFDKFSVIVAYEMNGAAMSRREKGPLWLVYPLDQYDELQTPRYRDRMVWQLRTITVQ